MKRIIIALIISAAAVQAQTNAPSPTNIVHAPTNRPTPIIIPQSLRSLLVISNRLHVLGIQSMEAQSEFDRTLQHLRLQREAKAISDAQSRHSFQAAQDKWLARRKAIETEAAQLRLREYELRKLHPLPGNEKQKRPR